MDIVAMVTMSNVQTASVGEIPDSGVNQFYDGSKILNPLTDIIGLPIDQVNFLACQFVALLLGFPYRTTFSPQRVSPTSRHVIQILIGVPLTYFCFGRQIFLLVIQSVVCLALMRVLSPGVMEKCVLIFAMGFLCVCHLYRMYYDYAGYTLDITGPLMLNTQRLSSLAYNLRDGYEKNKETLTENMRRYAIRRPPSILESLSYIFCFHGLMVGPFCFFKDYIAFIEGNNYLVESAATHKVMNHVNHVDENHKSKPKLPLVPRSELLKKLVTTLIFGISTITILPLFPSTLLTDPDFKNYSFLYKNLLIVFMMSLTRHKYYFAWKLGEAVNASSGLGFNGYDEKGKARWDLVDNADIMKIELATSNKQLLDNWNISTTNWLRYVVYERTRSTMLVFLFSACWHGFYAGYYLTFISAGMFLNMSKMLRRLIRPHFQGTRYTAFIYDVVTWVVTKVSLPYVGFPFVLLAFWPCFEVYKSVYFYQHIIVLILFAFLSSKAGKGRSKSH